MAAAQEVSMDAAIAAVLLELDKIFSFKEEQRKALKASQKRCSHSFLNWLWQE